MNKILCIILFWSVAANATETVTLTHNYKNLDFAVSFNDGNHFNGHKIDWYYKGMSEQINDYIGQKVIKNELIQKKVNISIWLFPISTCDCCPIEISQNKNGYYISISSKQLDLERIVQIIDYFSSDKWESFVCNDPDKSKYVANKILFEKLDSIVGKSDMSFFENNRTTVFEINELKIFYQKDSLNIIIGDKDLGININFKTISIPPIILDNYYIIASDDSIFIYDGADLRSSTKRPKQYERYAEIIAHKSWMNYYDGSDCVLSYSLEKNKFYYLKKKNDLPTNK